MIFTRYGNEVVSVDSIDHKSGEVSYVVKYPDGTLKECRNPIGYLRADGGIAAIIAAARTQVNEPAKS